MSELNSIFRGMLMYLLMAGCTTQISQAAPSSTSSLSSPALVGASTVFQLVVKANMTQASYPSESAEAKAEALTLIGSGHSLEFCSVIQATLGASINIVETIISHIDIYIHTLESWNLIDRLHEDEAASDQGINAVMCALNDERLYVPLIERVLLSHESPTHYTLHQLPTSQPSTTTPLIYAAKHLRSNTAVQYLVNVSLEYDRQVQLEERNRMDWLNVNLQDFEGNTALMYACKFNLNRQSIDSLLKIPDINVNARNFHDIPNEVMINTTDTTAADITSKSDARFWSIDAKNCPEGCRLHQGETALMLATMYGNKDAVEALVHYSKGVYEKKIKAIKMLLEVAGDAGTSSSNGDHSDTTDSKYNQVLVRDIDVLIESSLLSSFGNTRLLDSKIRLAGIDLVQRQEDHADQQQLFISVKESDWSRIQKSLSTSFVEMNIPTLNFNSHMDPKLNDLGTTPLLMAANGCDKEIVTILLAHGADSSVHIDHGDGGYSSIIDLIRDRQLNAINLDTKAKCGETETAIHTAFQTNPNNVFLATELGFKDTLKMLVKDNGNDVNFIAGSSSFYKGYSPLMLAVVSNNTEMVKFLVWGLNAIVDVANDNHDTALMVAIEKNMTGMVKLLVQRMGASVDAGKVLYTALYRKGLSDQIMNTLLDRKPRVSAVDYDNIVEMKIEEESATNEGDDHWVLLPSKSTAMALKYGLECELGLDGLSKLTSDEIRSMLEIKLKTAEGGFDAAFVKEVVINSGVF